MAPKGEHHDGQRGESCSEKVTSKPYVTFANFGQSTFILGRCRYYVTLEALQHVLHILLRFGMLLDVAEAEEHVITREVYASVRRHTEPRAALLATRGVGTELSENNMDFVHNLSLTDPFN